MDDIKKSRLWVELVDAKAEIALVRKRLQHTLTDLTQTHRVVKVVAFWTGVSLAVRFIYLFTTRNNEVFQFLILDGQSYWRWAGDILTKGPTTPAVTFTSPLYAYVLAILRFVTHDSVPVIISLQTMLGGLYPAVVGALAFIAISPSAAGWAAAIAALWGALVFYDALILKTQLTVWLVTLGLLTLYMAKSQKRLRLFALSGFIWGLAALARENTLLFPAFLAVGSGIHWIARRVRLPKTAAFTNFFAVPVLFFFVLLVPILPITLKNYFVGHDLVLIGTSGGMNFYQGNFIGSDGVLMPPSFVRPDPEFEERDAHNEAERRAGNTLKPSEGSSFWTRQTLHEIEQAPTLFFRNSVLKALYHLNASEISDNYQPAYYRRFTTPLAILLPDGVVILLSLVGILFLVNSKMVYRTRLLFIWMILYMASLVFTHYNARYRLEGWAPVLVIFAGIGASGLWTIIKARAHISGMLLLLFSLGIGSVVYASYPAVGLNTESVMESHLGTYYLETVKDYAKASDHFEKSLTADPTYQWSEVNLARARAKLADVDGAITHIKNAITLRPDMAYTYDMLGFLVDRKSLPRDAFLKELETLEVLDETKEHGDQIPTEGFLLLQQGAVRKALELLSREATIYPDNALILVSLGTAYKQDGQYEKAEVYLTRALVMNGSLIPARYNLGLMYLSLKRYDDAAKTLSQILPYFPEYEHTLAALGDVYQSMGNRVEAKKYYLRYIVVSETNAKRSEMVEVVKSKILSLGI